MEFKYHFIIGAVTSSLITYAFDLSYVAGAIIFAFSVLIDIDHYLWYAVAKKDANPFHAIKWYRSMHPKWIKMSPEERKKYKKGVFILHSVPLLILLFVVSTYISIFLWISIGFLIHLICDWVALLSLKEPFYQKMFPCLLIKNNQGKKALFKKE